MTSKEWEIKLKNIDDNSAELLAFDAMWELHSDLSNMEKERDEEFDIATGYHKRWCKWQDRAERAEARVKELEDEIEQLKYELKEE
jgi:hypothetical protein